MELKQIQGEILKLTTKITEYSKLTPEDRAIVDKYIAKIDLKNLQSIDEFEKQEAEEIYRDLNMLIGVLKTHDTNMDELINEFMISMGENSISGEENYVETLKELPITAEKRAMQEENYTRVKELSDVDDIREKLENIRCELSTNAKKLEIMSGNSTEQYTNIQYQIIALQQVRKRIQEEKKKKKVGNLTERTFLQIDEIWQLGELEKRIESKIINCRGMNIITYTRDMVTILLAQYDEELASIYDQVLSSLLPVLKGIMAITNANDSFIQGVEEIHGRLVGKINERLRIVSQYLKKTIQKTQNSSEESAIDIDSESNLKEDVIKVISLLRTIQEEGKSTNKTYIKVLEEFRKNLIQEKDNKKSFLPEGKEEI